FVSKDTNFPNSNVSDLVCNDFGSLDAHIPDTLRAVVPEIAVGATKAALNATLDFHRSPFSLIPFPVVATGKQPPAPATTPLQCDANLTVGEPPSAAPDNISRIT